MSVQAKYKPPRFPHLRGAAKWIPAAIVLIVTTGLVVSVLLSSFSTSWMDSWLPSGWTTNNYVSAWKEFGLGKVFIVTIQVAVSVIILSVALGLPAAYALSRGRGALKRFIPLLLALPVAVPPITYGIPLATLLIQIGIGGSLAGVIVANLVPSVAIFTLTMLPFVEEIDVRIELAARTLGASTWTVLTRLLARLLLPGILTSCVLVLVRTIVMFDLSFLTSGPNSQPLVVVLYYIIFAPGVRSTAAIDAVAVMYMMLATALLIVAMVLVNPVRNSRKE